MHRLTPDHEAELLRSYENEWEPGNESIDSFVDRHQVSKQQLYNVLKKYGVRPKSQRRVYRATPAVSSTMSKEDLVDSLLAELVTARRTIKELSLRLRELEPPD
jgi:hypothetical protein